MANIETLDKLESGMTLLVAGNQKVTVSPELAQQFAAGDRLSVVEKTGEILHIPAKETAIVEQAVGNAHQAFRQMGAVNDEQISAFFEGFATRLADDAIWLKIQEVNDADIADAKRRGRSTTRLEATEKLRMGMIEGLRGWITADSMRGKVIEKVQHDSWSASLIGSELGVVGFVFEGRPNVVADATGVLRGGNTVVFRIGRDALKTASAIIELACQPALIAAGLPKHAVSLVESPAHAAGWAMFSDTRLSLAVARGSGPAVDTLGSLAQKAGVPVSLHGTGGAWILATANTDAADFTQAVFDSLDRKVCNTLNTCCIQKSEIDRLIPAFLDALEKAGKRRSQPFKLHVAASDATHVPASLFETKVSIRRAEGNVEEFQAETIADDALGHEWEWEDAPEVTLKIVDTLETGVTLFNQYSPQFVAALVSSSASEHATFYQTVNAPFVGDGFTRWVDGQFALKRPELGLSNWQNGRLFGRGGVLSGDSVFTVRTRVAKD